MKEPTNKTKSEKESNLFGGSGISRSDFLKYAGASAVVATSFGLASCSTENTNPSTRLVVTDITPPKASPGSEVTIKGMNFSSNTSYNKVTFGSTQATIKSASSTKLVVIAPKSLKTGQTYKVTVTVGNNSVTAKQQFTAVQGKVTLDLGSGDVGVLNFAYALEQLEAAFYTQAVDAMPAKMSFPKQVLNDVKKHEITHRQWFKLVLASVAKDKSIPDISGYFDVSFINFDDLSEVYTYASALEQTGVGAYNGAGPLLTNSTYLLLAGKIVSVEARHAATFNSLIKPNTGYFAEDHESNTGFGVSSKGLGEAFSPKETLQHAAPFISSNVSIKLNGKVLGTGTGESK
jgi:rubrerythrin